MLIEKKVTWELNYRYKRRRRNHQSQRGSHGAEATTFDKQSAIGGVTCYCSGGQVSPCQCGGMKRSSLVSRTECV